MFRRRPVAVPPRERHSNPIIDSHLRTVDLLRDRVRDKQHQANALHRRIRGLTAGSTFDRVRELIATLEIDIDKLMPEIDHRQAEAEAAEARWLERASGRSEHFHLQPDEVQDGQNHQDSDEDR